MRNHVGTLSFYFTSPSPSLLPFFLPFPPSSPPNSLSLLSSDASLMLQGRLGRRDLVYLSNLPPHRRWIYNLIHGAIVGLVFEVLVCKLSVWSPGDIRGATSNPSLSMSPLPSLPPFLPHPPYLSTSLPPPSTSLM